MKKFATLLLLVSTPMLAQTADRPFELSIRNIMRGPELYGRRPENIQWSADSRWIYFTWVEAGKPWYEKPAQFRVPAGVGGIPQRLSPLQMDSLGPLMTLGSRSTDGGLTAVSFQGDLFIIDNKGATARRMTRTVANETRPVFSANSRRVYFVRDNNVYSVETLSGMTSQVTDIRLGDAPDDSTKPASKQHERLATQQRDLLDAVRDTLRADSVARAMRKMRESLLPKPIYVGKDVEIAAIDISPNGQGMLITLSTTRQPEETSVPFFVTESGYTRTRKGRSKVGDIDTRYTVLYVSLPDGKTNRLKLFANDSSASFVEFLGWNSSGSHAAFYAFRPDNKMRMLYTITEAGALNPVEQLRDTAWVDGPCVTCGGWYDEGKRLWYVSEATGFAHLYTANPAGSDRRQLTAGRWEVRKVMIRPDDDNFYLITNEISPFEEQLYRLPIRGGTPKRITTKSGGHDVAVSPNGKLLADVYSYVNVPPDLYVLVNEPNAEAAQLTHSPSAEWRSARWMVPQRVMVPASDGARVPAHVYHPSEMGAQPNGAAVIFVHGAGYLHNVGNFWSQYPREYMFHHFLAKQGYIVIDLDYRASDGYGRDWRTAIYRWMGGRDLQDHVDASRYLTRQYAIPPERIGIYGGSYGGFMTLMALFTEPNFFGAGAALRSVTDWAHYNQGYTSNILNLPQNDTVAYRRSSPIYFADGLRAPLLMAHGMVDVNVQYQDIVRLTQRLIELGKTDWELASYPVEDHAFVRPSSWADEYTRIFNLFERTIRKPK